MSIGLPKFSFHECYNKRRISNIIKINNIYHFWEIPQILLKNKEVFQILKPIRSEFRK